MRTKITTLYPFLLLLVLFYSCEEEGIEDNGFGKITGTVVTMGDNTPLENVKISTTPASNTVFTNENGFFEIDAVVVGEYSVQAELSDYTTAFEAANVTDGQTINVVFEMEETSSSNLPPKTPILLYPEDEADNIATDVEFLWSSSQTDEDEISYAIEIRNGSTNEIIFEENIQDTTYSVSGLTLGINYFWQVTASDGINNDVVSNLQSFSTTDPSNNRFYYVRKTENNNIIYSGSDNEAFDDDTNENEIQLTSSDNNSFRPRKNAQTGKIAFLRTVGADTHLFTMNVNGTDVKQVTNSIPVVGFRQNEVDFAWQKNGQRLFYSNLNKLYSINANGSGVNLIYETPANIFITEIDTNEINNFLAIKTNDASGYSARIVVINPSNDTEIAVVIENEPGALGGIDYSIDGTKVLYTRDISGFEGEDYRQLDSRIFEYNIPNAITTEIDTGKPAGTNDLDVKYSPNEGSIIYVNTSNDGISQKNIYKFEFNNTNQREILFTEAFMPDWE